MAKQCIYGFHAVNALLNVQAQSVQHIYLLQNRHDLRIHKIIQKADENQISIEYLSRHALDEMVGYNQQHQGVIAICTDLPHYHENDVFQLLTTLDHPALLLILDSVQDPHNLGACLRTANAMGVDAVITSQNRTVGLTPAARKVASGADVVTPFIQVTNLARTIRLLKQQGIWIIGTAANAELRLQDAELFESIAIVMGSEGKGMRHLTRELCDYIVRIDLLGTVDSLNISVAAGMCLYEVNRQRFRKET